MLSTAPFPILTGPNFSARPSSPKSPSSPRVRFPPPLLAFSSTTANASYTSTENYTSTYDSYLASPREELAACFTTTLYDVLGIPTGATCHEIKAAYRRLARTCHPDVVAAEIDRRDTSADEFIRIHAAYSTLSDPEKRADYDRKLFRGRNQPLTTAASGFNGYTRRNWETDQCW